MNLFTFIIYFLASASCRILPKRCAFRMISWSWNCTNILSTTMWYNILLRCNLPFDAASHRSQNSSCTWLDSDCHSAGQCQCRNKWSLPSNSRSDLLVVCRAALTHRTRLCDRLISRLHVHTPHLAWQLLLTVSYVSNKLSIRNILLLMQ